MKRFTFGTPEELVPSKFCPKFHYQETEVSFDPACVQFKETKRGCLLNIPLDPDEHIYGFGLQLNAFDRMGMKVTLRVNADPVAATGDSHAPVPFFVSTKGYGIYFDTARYMEFNMGVVPAKAQVVERANELHTSTDDLYAVKERQKESYAVCHVPVAKGVTIYVFEGKTITDIVAQYNMLSGGGPLVPDWGLGVFYRVCTRFNQEQVLNICRYFREKNIPCDILGLEPGWHSHAYSCTYDWNKELYPDVDSFLKQVQEMGFHLSLWEHCFTNAASPLYSEVAKGCGDYRVWDGLVPDFTLPEIRTAFAKHHKENVMKGVVDGFKLDECDSSDYTGGWSFPNSTEFPSGLDGEQYHCLLGTLYMQTMLEALDGKPTLSECRSGGALGASYPFVIYSDLYGHKEFLRGLCTAGFSGLLWTPEVRECKSRKDLIRRLQNVVFSPQCLVNAWYFEDVPWKLYDCENEVRELFELRERLIPMLQEAFMLYHEKGIAPIRALVSDYTDDPETYAIDTEYMFCKDLLVAPLTEEEEERDVYLPTGARWRDWFTKEPVASGHFTYKGEGIPVYEKY